MILPEAIGRIRMMSAETVFPHPDSRQTDGPPLSDLIAYPIEAREFLIAEEIDF